MIIHLGETATPDTVLDYLKRLSDANTYFFKKNYAFKKLGFISVDEEPEHSLLRLKYTSEELKIIAD